MCACSPASSHGIPCGESVEGITGGVADVFWLGVAPDQEAGGKIVHVAVGAGDERTGDIERHLGIVGNFAGEEFEPATADEITQTGGESLVHLDARDELDRAAKRIAAGEPDQATDIAFLKGDHASSGMRSPCAAISSSTMARICSGSSSAAVCGSRSAA